MDWHLAGRCCVCVFCGQVSTSSHSSQHIPPTYIIQTYTTPTCYSAHGLACGWQVPCVCVFCRLRLHLLALLTAYTSHAHNSDVHNTHLLQHTWTGMWLAGAVCVFCGHVSTSSHSSQHIPPTHITQMYTTPTGYSAHGLASGQQVPGGLGGGAHQLWR